MPKDINKTIEIDRFGVIRLDFGDFAMFYKKVIFWWILIGKKLIRKIKQIRKVGLRRRPGGNETIRAEDKEGSRGGKPPPGLGVLGGSEVQKERKFGGSEKKMIGKTRVYRIRRTAGALHADPVGRRIYMITYKN